MFCKKSDDKSNYKSLIYIWNDLGWSKTIGKTNDTCDSLKIRFSLVVKMVIVKGNQFSYFFIFSRDTNWYDPHFSFGWEVNQLIKGLYDLENMSSMKIHEWWLFGAQLSRILSWFAGLVVGQVISSPFLLILASHRIKIRMKSEDLDLNRGRNEIIIIQHTSRLQTLALFNPSSFHFTRNHIYSTPTSNSISTAYELT